MEKSLSKVQVALLSVASNTTLIIAKVIAGLLSGSVSIISEAIHSGMDLVASIIAFLSVKFSAHPADAKHPFGHGKIENVSGVVEGLLIFIAAFIIIAESIKKLIHPGEIHETWTAIGVMFLSAVVNTVVAGLLYQVAKKEDSVALEADALHLKTDVYTSVGVGTGLLLIKLTGLTMLDPLVAMGVALLIIKESWHLTKNAFEPLLDSSLPEEEARIIRDILTEYQSKIIDYHRLRTRKAGNVRFIDLHLSLVKTMTVAESHQLSVAIENSLKEKIKNAEVIIHIDPT